MKKKITNPRVYAALYLSRKNAAEKVIMANDIVSKMTDAVGLFSDPVPALTAVSAAAEDLSVAASAALHGSVADKVDAAQKENFLDLQLIRLKEYAESTANATADPAVASNMLVVAGFTLSKTPEKNPVPQPVSDIVAIFTNEAGKILLKWKTAKFVRVNNVFFTTTPDIESSWAPIGSTTKRKWMVENLASGTRYYFRVISVGSGGSSAPSVVASNITTLS